MPRIPRSIILLIVVVVLFALVWSRVRILIHIPLSPWLAILLFAVVVLVAFLLIDHFINRSRD